MADTHPGSISADELYQKLLADDELALIDVREIRPHSHGHPLFAIPLPLGRMELMVGQLIPCRNALIVVCDGGAEDAENPNLGLRAGRRLLALGYRNVRVLEDGCVGWKAAGYELFEGVNVPSKAFGEFVEEHEGTPAISPEELKKMQDENADMVILDSRPEEEFRMLSLPVCAAPVVSWPIACTRLFLRRTPRSWSIAPVEHAALSAASLW